MQLSAVPEGYISLADARARVSSAIANAANHDIEQLKKILDPDEVAKAPPKAMSRAAFKALYKPICRSELEVFAMHPASGEIVAVPTHVFTSSKDPSRLFSGPSPHFDAGLPTGYEQFGQLVFFVRNDNNTHEKIEAAIKSILSATTAQSAPPQAISSPETEMWAATAKHLSFWPLEFAIVFIGHKQNLDAAIAEYAGWMDYAPTNHLSELAFATYSVALGTIETLAKTGTIEVFGKRSMRNGGYERAAKISPREWLDLKLHHDFSGQRGIYAAVPGTVPFAEWWQTLTVERVPFINALSDAFSDKAAAETLKPKRGRKPGSPYAAQDRDLFVLIDKLIGENKAHSAHGAATLLASQNVKLPGTGTEDSRIRRLAGAYNKWKQRPS